MEWISVKDKLPTTNGKYVVECKTMMGNIHRVETTDTINDKGGVSWGVTNQVVLRWLKE